MAVLSLFDVSEVIYTQVNALECFLKMFKEKKKRKRNKTPSSRFPI